MGIRPSVSTAAVCRALAVAQAELRAGRKATLLSTLITLTGDKAQYCSAAVSEARNAGLIERGPKGYHLTDAGRAELARNPNWRPDLPR